MMNNTLRKKKTLVIAAAAVLIAGIGFGAGMMAKASMAAEKNDIGVNEAKSIALANVGVSEEKATFTKAKLDDDGHYEVDFYTNSTKYDFEIDAATGNILEKEAEARKGKTETAAPAQNGQSQSSSGQQVQKPSSGSNDASVIGVDSAKSIAVKHAGVSGASFQKAYLDHDDGMRVYELEFTAGGFEYDYEINAYTGAVIDWDKDRIEYDDYGYDD